MDDPLWFWLFFLANYVITISIETPVLLVGLSPRHSLGRRLFAGAWLTACTYPIVFVVLPVFFQTGEQRRLYLLIAETFAPVAECVLFWLAFGDANASRGSFVRDMAAVTAANLASFGLGELIIIYFWEPLLSKGPPQIPLS